MGYDVHITRKSDWGDEEGPTIPLEEWREYLSKDNEMRLMEQAEASGANGGPIRMVNEGAAIWTAYSAYKSDGEEVWFWHSVDEITVKYPSPEVRAKMYQIASALGATVQGDEGEVYGPDGEELEGAPGEESDESCEDEAPFDTPRESAPDEAPEEPPAKKPWWRFWR